VRLAEQEGGRARYQAKKGRDGHKAKGALVGVMRKLVLALDPVGAKGAAFERGRLFPGPGAAQPRPESAAE
jgi:hypothetical protein